MTKRRRDDEGASAVEFALVMPFLMVILFGIIIYGTVFAQSLSLSNSAREAARAAVVKSATCGDVSTLAKDAVSTIGMVGTDVNAPVIERGTSDANATGKDACGAGDQLCKGQLPGTNIYVRLTFDTDPIFPFIPVPDQLSGKGVFRCEWS